MVRAAREYEGRKGRRRSWGSGVSTWRRRLLALKLLARLLAAFLQLLLQPFVLVRDGLGIARRSIECLGEVGKRQRNAERLASVVQTLHVHRLACLHRADQVIADLVIGHATAWHAHDVWGAHGLPLIDNDTRPGLKRHAERYGDA